MKKLVPRDGRLRFRDESLMEFRVFLDMKKGKKDFFIKLCWKKVGSFKKALMVQKRNYEIHRFK